MSISQVQLIPATQLPIAAAAVLTAPALTTYRLGRTVFSNPTAAAATVTVYVVPPAGAAGAGNALINAVTVPPNGTYVSSELAGLILPPGASLWALASVAATVVCVASGTMIQ